jgi:hypothetical protein
MGFRIVVTGSVAEIITPLANGLAGPRVHKVLREGLREGGDKVRTKVRRALKEQMGVKKYGTIVRGVDGVLSHSGILRYIIRGSGQGLPIEEFPVSAKAGQGHIRWSRREHWKLQTRESLGRFGKIQDVPPEVTASPWGIARTFKRSFVAKVGYRAAIPGGKYGWVMRKLFGPGIAKEIVKDKSAGAFEMSVRTDVLPAIEKRLARLIGS